MIMLNYVSHELANKVYHLTKALDQTQKIVEVLEEENKTLKELIEKLQNQTDYSNDFCEIF
jgi:hypothetical protein